MAFGPQCWLQAPALRKPNHPERVTEAKRSWVGSGVKQRTVMAEKKEVVSRSPAPVEVPPPSVSPMLVVITHMPRGSGTGRAGGDVVLSRSGSPALAPTSLGPLLPATLRVKSRVSELLLYKHGEKS